MIKRSFCGPQHSLDRRAPVQICAMLTPGADGLIGPEACIKNSIVIYRPYWVFHRAQRTWIRIAPGEYVGDTECPKAEGASASLASFNGWIIPFFGRGRRIQHDKIHTTSCWTPDPGQTVSVAFTIRIDRFRRRVTLQVSLGDHGFGAQRLWHSGRPSGRYPIHNRAWSTERVIGEKRGLDEVHPPGRCQRRSHGHQGWPRPCRRIPLRC